jgi:flavodoxin
MGLCGSGYLPPVARLPNISVMRSNLNRRTMLTALATLPAASSAAHGERGDERRKGSDILVAYFSRSGNTRLVAGLIHRALGTDLFEIRPAMPYPDDYLEQVKKATEERDRGFEPTLAATVPDIAGYQTVYLGFPIWGETAPAIIRSFLRKHDLAGKTLVPFITHGGYGLGNSRSVLASHAPRAQLQRAFSMQADQERQTMNAVNGWLQESKTIATPTP